MVAEATSTSWRTRYADKLVSPEEAVQVVKDGDSVWLGGWTGTPATLAKALGNRAGALRHVAIETFLSPYQWDFSGREQSFSVRTFYAGPLDREGTRNNRFEYIPLCQWREGEAPPGIAAPHDVSMVNISAPDDEGWCSFGGAVWFAHSVTMKAKTIVGEVHEDWIRTGGQNRVHVSQFGRLALAQPSPEPPVMARSEETIYAAEVICTLLASEIVKDGMTLQIGVGDVSAALLAYLGDKHDLGIHSEMIPGGIVDLVRNGVVTGKHYTLHPGKVVGSALVLMPREDLAFIDGNPMFELYDFTHTDDLRNLLRIENFFAVNNAMEVDITGNVCSETRGPQVYSGPGGQPVFGIASSTSSGGSCVVLPSSQLVDGARYPRIVSRLEHGATATQHRGYVDYVVTEQGIARLRGKTLRERIGELISVAHPDFRAELKADARRLYGVDV
ncbi:MAG TPA: acetyl-CoA hydrolase/transferase C-terminal domain-containing protein [Dehalococcoidia bacterium]|nr:acetyl-CoA hydrolase/transferase C-terminal domain-containing protein [Dehalococcoidia bacterium]